MRTTTAAYGKLNPSVLCLLSSLSIVEGPFLLPHHERLGLRSADSAAAALVFSEITANATTRLNDLKVTHQVPLHTVVAEPHPDSALVDSVSDHLGGQVLPRFCFIRGTEVSNTPSWVFVTWFPDPSNAALAYHVAGLRAAFSHYLSSRTVTSAICCTVDNLRMVHPLLSLTTPPVSALQQKGIETLQERREQDAVVYFSPALMLPSAKSPGLTSLQKITIHLSAALSSMLTPLLVPFTPSSCSLTTATPSIPADSSRFPKRQPTTTLSNGSAVLLRLDDTTSILIGETVVKCSSPGQLAESFTITEPRYCLAAFSNTTALLLLIPNQKYPVLNFMYPMCKPTVRHLLEHEFCMLIHRTADVRHGDTLFSIFHADNLANAADAGEQFLRVADTSLRPHPVNGMTHDPFLHYQMVMDDVNKEIRHVPVGGAKRFRF